MRTQKSSFLITNNQFLHILNRTCADVGEHGHERLEGSCGGGGMKTTMAAAYAPLFCRTYAETTRDSWLASYRPTTHVLPELSLKEILSNAGLNPPDLGLSNKIASAVIRMTAIVDRVGPLPVRPTHQEGGSTGSGEIPLHH